ncbi:uncharacterized protein QC764_0108440 [Podospora pseudoanserina]|uniref:Transporter n=1 Tax=Podospora pseudoanserina TaxID=2609844 RepID=A0ABR0HMF3_9PEZI|nr:hypothetical protein QC764_0108440 [Podospora pseudoanserina]
MEQSICWRRRFGRRFVEGDNHSLLSFLPMAIFGPLSLACWIYAMLYDAMFDVVLAVSMDPGLYHLQEYSGWKVNWCCSQLLPK